MKWIPDALKHAQDSAKRRHTRVTKILVSLDGNDVAPRFDLSTEVLIASVMDDGAVADERTLILPAASAEKLCHLILSEDVRTVVCGGIEEEHFQYLAWKKIAVLDSVMGPVDRLLERYAKGELRSGDILFDRQGKQMP